MNHIASIDHFNLWSFDLNLLVAFDALMRERSVTKAAVRLRIQQPAMSHNLGTLRMLLKDDLFIRVGQVMQPTPRAIVLSGTVRQILEEAQRALLARATFCPEAEMQTFTIGFSSELEVLLLPTLAARIQCVAPNIKLQGRPVQPDEVHRALNNGFIDLAIGCFADGSLRHRHRPLFKQSLMCCWNPLLLDLPAVIDREAYLGQRHVLVSQNATIRGCLDDALRVAKVELNVVMAAPEFLTVLDAARQAAVVATLPSRIVRRYAPLLGLAMSPIPLKLAVTPISMVWAAHADHEPAAEWLRQQAQAVLAEMEPTEAD